MRRLLSPVSLGLLCLALGLPTMAWAKAPQRALLLSYAGSARADELALVQRLAKALGADTLRYGKQLAGEIERVMSRDPGTLEGAEAFRAAVKNGRQQFIEGNYASAVSLLESASQKLFAKSALLAKQQDLRAPLHEALLFLAHAHLRSGRNRQAADVISEAVRSFPDRHPSLANYAPDLVKLYKSVRLELRKQKPVTLEIAANVPGCLAFVNGRYVGITPTKVTDLLAGRYRIYVQQPKHRGRVHLVDVSRTAKLSVDFTLDTSLTTRPRVALRYNHERAMRDHQVAHATLIGRAIRVREVIVVGFQFHQERRALHGSVISVATGRPIRSGLLALEPSLPNDAEVRALGHFLRSRDTRHGVMIGVEEGPTAEPSDGGFFDPRVWRWITLGLGAVSAGVGVSLVVMDGDGTCNTGTTCQEVYQTGGTGVAMIVAGGAALVGSAILFWVSASRAESAARSSTPSGTASSFAPWVAPGAAGVMATGRF